MDKPLLFPDVKDFRKLFSRAVPREPSPPRGHRRDVVVHRYGDAAQVLGDLTVRRGEDYELMTCLPRPALLEAVERNMLSSDYRISFKAGTLAGSPGEMLVTAEYDRILGSRWVAVVDAATVAATPVGDADALYEDLVEHGVEMDHHESDLYVIDTEQTRAIMQVHRRVVHDETRQGPKFVHPFFGNDPVRRRWLEVPFGYMPFWKKKCDDAAEAAARRA